MKASIIVISVHHSFLSTLKDINLFVVSNVLIARVSPEWRLKPGSATQKKCPFLLNRGVPLKEVTNTKIMWALFRDQILCPLNGGVP